MEILPVSSPHVPRDARTLFVGCLFWFEKMPLSSEQQARIRANQAAAKAKLEAKSPASSSKKRHADAATAGTAAGAPAAPTRSSPARKAAPKAGTLAAFFGGGAKAAKRPKLGASTASSAAASSSPSSSSSSAAAGAGAGAATASDAATVFCAADLDESWRGALGGEFSKSYWRSLNAFLGAEYRGKTPIFPPRELVFSWSSHCKFEDVKVVVLGQDPYHGPGQAHGLAFSVQRGVATPPSLRNMLAEAATDVGTRAKPPHGNLEAWARQGVLLLNTCLTVRKAQANSHQKKGWEAFTDAVVREIGRRREGVVFLLWGKPAAARAAGIDRKKHHVLMSSHPSPLAYTKTNAPFKGSKVFSKTNALLQEMGKEPIDWAI